MPVNKAVQSVISEDWNGLSKEHPVCQHLHSTEPFLGTPVVSVLFMGHTSLSFLICFFNNSKVSLKHLRT